MSDALFGPEGDIVVFDKIGNLRPWEAEKLSKIYNHPEQAGHFVKNFYKHFNSRFSQRITLNDAEVILFIATDARSVLQKNVNLLHEISDSSLPWQVFLMALDRKPLTLLEDIISASNVKDQKSAIKTEAATSIVKSYLKKNKVSYKDLPLLVGEVGKTLDELSKDDNVTTPLAYTEKPNINQIRKSIGHDGIVSFIDGRSYKTLKRHLTIHGLTPEDYRAKYGLPADYPMVAPGYAEQRSALAKAIGLGQPGVGAERERGDRGQDEYSQGGNRLKAS